MILLHLQREAGALMGADSPGVPPTTRPGSVAGGGHAVTVQMLHSHISRFSPKRYMHLS